MTLKALKAAFQPGVRVTVIDHWIPGHIGAERTVTKTQGNGYWYTVAHKGDKRLWGDFVKASELTFDGKMATMRPADQVHGQPGRFWTLRIDPAV